MYYVTSSGGQKGPYHIDEIKSMCASGELTTDDLCWTEPWTEWRPVSEIVGDRPEPRVPRRPSAPPLLPAAQNRPNLHEVDAAQVGKAGLNELLCSRCGVLFMGKPKRTFFLGMRKFSCGACGHQNIYPPGNGTMGCFFIVIVLTILMSVSILNQGGLPLPGLVFFVAVSGLVEGFRARRRIKASRRFFQDKAGGPR